MTAREVKASDTDRRGERTTPGHTKLAEFLHPDLTRRDVLIGAGSVSAAYATGAKADGDTGGWRFVRIPDLQHPDRLRIEAQLNGQSVLALRETAFGERARFSERPIGKAPCESEQPPGRRLVVSGAQLVGDDTFTLFMDFRSCGGAGPSLDIAVYGWIFEGSAASPLLLASGPAAAFGAAEGVAILPKQPSVANAVAEKLRYATFNPVAVRAAPSVSLTARLTIESQGDRVVWTLAASDDGVAFVIPLRAKVPLARAKEIKAIARAKSLAIWRRVDPIDQAAQIGTGARRNGDDKAQDSDPKVAAETSRTSAQTGPRTLAIMGDAAVVNKVAFGEATFEDKTTSLVGMSEIDSPKRSAFPFRLSRSIDMIDPGRSEVIKAEVPVAGKLSIDTIENGKPDTPAIEGPFAFDDGSLEVCAMAGGSSLTVNARLALARKAFCAVTSWGPFSLARPDECADCGANKQSPSVTTRSVDGKIRAFELVARAFDAGVALEDSATPPSIPTMTSRSSASRLDFPGGVEVLFRLQGAEDAAGRAPRLGLVMLGVVKATVPPRAMPGSLFKLPLEGGVLRITRWTDLMALAFRFSGLDLVGDGASFSMRARGPSRVTSAPAIHDGAGSLVEDAQPRGECPPARAEPPDARPMMVVEFPPQHIAEQAFFTRTTPRPTLPEPPVLTPAGQAKVRSHLRTLRSAYRGKPATEIASLRLAARNAIQKLYQDASFAPSPASPADDEKASPSLCDSENASAKDYATFAKAFGTHKDAAALPAEQRVYIGSDWLDAPARRLAERVATAAQSFKLPDELPEDPVDQSEVDAIRRELPEGKAFDAQAEDEAQKRRKSRDPFYIHFKEAYENKKNQPKDNALVALVPRYAGRADLQKRLSDAKAFCPGSTAGLREFLHWLDTQIATVSRALNVTGIEALSLPAKARLSGPSRLAFRINTDEGDDGLPGGAIPFTIDGLTNWGRFDLAVVRRAEKLFDPTEDGSRRDSGHRREDVDLFRQLDHQGFSKGGLVGDAKCSPIQRLLRIPSAKVSASQRLAEIVASSSAPPTDFETAIELPFRLLLSPSQDARFRTCRVVPDALFGQEKPSERKESFADQPLWTAAHDVSGVAKLRAVWSPDFRPEAFLAHETDGPAKGERSNRAPLRGPYAPWNLPRDLTTSSDDFENRVKALTPFRTSLDAFDRHEIVALSSVYGLPVIGRVNPAGGRVGVDQREPPEGFKVGGLRGTRPTDDPRMKPERWPDLNDIYIPRPLPVDELALSALGGFLTLDADFEPPAAARLEDGRSLFDALSIERWKHRIVLGRDISAEVLYKGYLFPIGLRASLVKITERRIERAAECGPPVAVLRQRMFLRVAKPVKAFPAFRQPNNGRRFPFAQVELITTQSPDLVDPFDYGGEAAEGVRPSGLIDLKPFVPDAFDRQPRGKAETPGAAFWPRTGRRPGAEVLFDVAFGPATTRIPLIFVDNVAVNNDASMASLCAYYNRLSDVVDGASRPERRRLVVAPLGGAKVRFAPELKPGDTEFETATITLSAEGKTTSEPPCGAAFDPYQINVDYETDAFMQGLDQPPFFPAIKRANIKIGQMERLAGQPVSPVDVAYDGLYTLCGFDEPGKIADNPRAIHLDLLDQRALSFGRAGDRGGAVGRPELNAVALSRSHGVIGRGGGQAAVEPTDTTLPTVATNTSQQSVGDFFSGSAKLLGVVSFKELLEDLADIAFEPKLREIVDYGAGLADQGAVSLKSKVIEPLSRLVDETSGRLAQLRVQGTSAADALAAAYPELASALPAFGQALKDALAAAPPTEGGAAISAYSQVYESGRRFVDAALRVSRDPITPLRAATERALHQRFASITDDIAKANTVAATIKKLIDTSGRRTAKDLIVDTVMIPLSPGIFALPPPAEVDPDVPPAALEKAIASAIETALKDEAAWPGVADPQNPFFDPAAFVKRLTQALKDPSAETSIRDALNAQAEALEASASAAEGKVEGYLWSLSQSINDAATDAIKPLPDSVDLAGLFQRIATIGAKVGSVRTSFEQLKVVQTFADQACASAAKALSSLLVMITPSGALEDSPPDCNEALADCLSAASYPSGPYALYPAIYRLQKGLHVLLEDTYGIFARVEKRLPAGASRGAIEELRSLVARERSVIDDLAKDLKEQIEALHSAVDQFSVAVEAVQGQLEGAASCTAGADSVLIFLRSLPALAKGVNATRWHLVASVGKAAKGLGALLAAPFAKAVDHSDETPSSIVDYADDPGTWTAEAWITTAEADDVIQILRARVTALVAPAIHAALAFMGHASSAGAWIKLPPDEPFAKKAKAAASLKTSLSSLDALLASASEPIKSTYVAIKTAYVVEDPKASIVQQVAESLQKKLDAARSLKAAIEEGNLKDAREAVRTIVTATADPTLPELEDVGKRLLGALDKSNHKVTTVSYGIEQARSKIEIGAEALETRALSLLTALLYDVDATYSKLLVQALPAARALAEALENVFAIARKKRDELLNALGDDPINGKLRGLLLARAAPGADSTNDGLAQQHNKLKRVVRDLSKAPVAGKLTAETQSAIIEFFDLLEGWGRGDDPKKTNAIIVILAQVKNAGDELLRGNVAAVIDIDPVRKEVERRLKEMIPSKITLAYDFETKLTKGVGGLFNPGTKADPESNLKLSARTVTDVLKGGATQTSVVGDLGPFSIKLLPFFDVVTLYFNGARYTNGVDGGGKFSIQFADFEFGEMASFLAALSSYISFGDSGFYLALRSDIPSVNGLDFGIEAGYRMAPINLSIGTLSFINVSLNASCVLPFGDGRATFKVGVSRPEAPFLITAFPFGGSGHLALYASAKGMIGFEASFAFGAAAAFAFGPLVGQGFVMSGIFLRNIKVQDNNGQDQTASTLEGYFIAAGSARIACFSTSTSLTIKFGQQPSGKMAGSAVFTFSFSFGVKDIEFRVTAYKEEGKGFSSPRQSVRIETIGPVRYAALSSTLSDATVQRAKSGWSARLNQPDHPVAVLKSTAVCKGDDFRTYRSYFSDLEPWAPI